MANIDGTVWGRLPAGPLEVAFGFGLELRGLRLHFGCHLHGSSPIMGSASRNLTAFANEPLKTHSMGGGSLWSRRVSSAHSPGALVDGVAQRLRLRGCGHHDA